MKIKFLVILILSSLIFTSCSNDKTIVNKERNIDSKKVTKLEKLPTEEVKKMKEEIKVSKQKAEKLEKDMNKEAVIDQQILKKDAKEYFANESDYEKQTRLEANKKINDYMEKIRAQYQK